MEGSTVTAEQTMGEALERIARRFPDKEALVFGDTRVTLGFPLTSYLLNVRQRWHVAEGRVAPFGIIVAHPPIHNRDQLADGLSLQEQRVPLGLETTAEGPSERARKQWN